MIISYKGSSQKAKELQIDTITDLDTINSDRSFPCGSAETLSCLRFLVLKPENGGWSLKVQPPSFDFPGNLILDQPVTCHWLCS